MASNPRGRRRDAAANREKLLAAAGDLFAERGLAAPLEEVARRSQVSIGTLYNHFPTRESLFDAIYPDRLTGLRVAGEKALSDPDPWAGFRDFLITVFELQAADRGLNDAMTLRYPAAAAMSEACDRGYASIEQIVDRAKAEGVLRADFTLPDLACLIWATSRVITATVDVAPEAWRRYLDLQLDGLRAAAAHPSEVPPMTAEQVAAAMRA
ncbi:TetR/AcrR family transcriptional regulator [Microlunatus parietis]|uniref:AcrR family transcriptional regulator n=1 Tax=Microlunatus parietis TaxID=682979 RepID=A0A7Y9L959_9ACTN|nr:TetR/AcrR family transcriptional regulator [Microlunatus parietis]NYE71459.1 AcrR family transcriptional regulator [Microlunatus parietis]